MEYAPNKLKYEYRAESPQVVIFSDIYYPKGWTATIDGEEASYFRANYILRGMQVPEGERTISFEFKPKSYFTGSKISIVASILLILLVIGGIVRELRLQKGKQE